jgi:hypothetical protein
MRLWWRYCWRCWAAVPSGNLAGGWRRRRGANYTEDFIYDFWIYAEDGRDTGVGSVLLNEFSKGGTTGNICCGLMPGVGQTVKVVWRVGGRREEESQWRTYRRDVSVMGAMPKEDAYNILLVRFFRA